MSPDTEQTLDKRVVICPLSFALGFIQNYRTTERPNKGCLESRPVKGTDAFADDFFKVLHAPKGEEVEVTHSSGRTITLRGLGQDGAQALKFPMKAGLAARQAAVKAVNKGLVRAPKKNWDKTFGPEKTYQYVDPKDGQTYSFQLGGGTEIDKLKDEFPELYNVTRSKTTSQKDDDDDVIDDDALSGLTGEMSKPIETEDKDLKALVADPEDEDEDDEDDDEFDDDDEMVGEPDTTSSDEEPAYAAVEVEETQSADDMMSDLGIEDTTKSGQSAAEANQEGNLQGAAQMRHKQKEQTGSGRVEQFDAGKDKVMSSTSHSHDGMHILQFEKPEGAQEVRGQAIKWMDNGEEHTQYKVQDPHCGAVNWFEDGANHCRVCGEEVVIQTN